jgi:hypothetical protein
LFRGKRGGKSMADPRQVLAGATILDNLARNSG